MSSLQAFLRATRKANRSLAFDLPLPPSELATSLCSSLFSTLHSLLVQLLLLLLLLLVPISNLPKVRVDRLDSLVVFDSISA